MQFFNTLLKICLGLQNGNVKHFSTDTCCYTTNWDGFAGKGQFTGLHHHDG